MALSLYSSIILLEALAPLEDGLELVLIIQPLTSAWPLSPGSSYLCHVLLEALIPLEDSLEYGLFLQFLLTSVMFFWRPSFLLKIA